MTSEKIKAQLPSGPSTLCFDKDEFTKENFSIDRFVSDCCKHVQLEKLREDLGLYLRLLRTAMIELINQDYADFVNLSSNLVGLDKSINNLSVPLGQLREEIKSVKDALDEGLYIIESKLELRKKIRDKKVCLQNLMTSVLCVERIENLLRIEVSSSSNNNDVGIKGELMERVASEFNQLQFVTSKVAHLPLIETMKPRVEQITNVLQTSLETSFLNSLQIENKDSVTRCLRIYSTIDRINEAENLFRKKIVSPYLESVVNEDTLKLPGGLKTMFKKVLEFIPKHCSLLKSLQQTNFSYENLNGFDFLVNSVWPEIVTVLEIRTPAIFDLTDPNAFHQRYLIADDFLENFEKELETDISINNFRNHPSYTIFMNKWNLPVYFQIRFQEIAGTLEKSLISEITTTEQTEDREFQLFQTAILWECLLTCWSSDVVLHPLVHKFWKLSLLIFARFNKWISDTFLPKFSQEILKEPSPPLSTEKLNLGSEKIANGVANSANDILPIAYLVDLTQDIHNILNKLDYYVDNVVLTCASKISQLTPEDFRESANEIKNSLKRVLPKVNEAVAGSICSRCTPMLKSVYDIPRLFRKTNREVPNKPSTYTSSILAPLHTFHQEHKVSISSDNTETWLQLAIADITSQYLNVTTEVLTSVKKMEDSLKRLKRARDKSSPSPMNNSTGMTDDDKIRLQIALDVEYFKNQVVSLGVDCSSIPSLSRIVELVESARSSPAPS